MTHRLLTLLYSLSFQGLLVVFQEVLQSEWVWCLWSPVFLNSHFCGYGGPHADIILISKLHQDICMHFFAWPRELRKTVQHLLSLSQTLSPCWHYFLKSLMLGCPLQRILLSHVSRKICTGVFWGCVVRGDKRVLSKQKNRKKKSEFRQTLQQIWCLFIQKPKPKQPNKQTKPKPTENHNNQRKTTKMSPTVLVFNLKVLVVCPSFKKDKDVYPYESLNRSEWTSEQAEALKVTNYSKL